MKNHLVRYTLSCGLWLATAMPLWAQFDLPPVDAPKAPATGPATRPLQVITPEVDAARHQITLPAEFWNPKLTDWVEVALSGRPGDFLHETLVCVTTTRTKLLTALHAAGFQDSDTWVANRADLPRIRGDRALILVELTRQGTPPHPAAPALPEIYSLDELLTFQGWNVSLGPCGWIFKGGQTPAILPSPGEAGNSLLELPTTAAATAPANGKETDGLGGGKLSPAQQIIRDDPQFALVLRGIQHTSLSIMDYPLAYDDWIYPPFRIHRNYKMLPADVLDGNGSVPLKLTIRKVTETELLQESARVWHDADFAKYILQQLPIAAQIDAAKTQLAGTLPALRKRAEMAAGLDTQPLEETAEFGRVAVLAAQIEQGYRQLDAAWAQWASTHAQFEAQNDAQRAEFKANSILWQTHMTQERQRAEQLAQAEEAGAQMRELVRRAASPERDQFLRAASARQIAARSQALVLENAQTLEYWGQEQKRLQADDPRQAWRDHIARQLELAQVRTALGQAGVALSQKMLAPGASATEARTYRQALLKVGQVGFKAQLEQVNFEISKRDGIDNDPDLAGLLQQRATILKKLQEAEDALKKEDSRSATTQP